MPDNVPAGHVVLNDTPKRVHRSTRNLAVLSDAIGAFSFGVINHSNIKCCINLIGHKTDYYFLKEHDNDRDKALASASTEALANILGAIYTDSSAKETIALYMPQTAVALERFIEAIITGDL